MGIGAIGKLTVMFGADFKGFNRALKKAQRNMAKVGKSMKRIGSSMTRNLTMPMVGLGAIAIKTFATFEQSMLKVKAVSGATGAEFQSLVENAKRLGSSTMFTASQVSGLQLELSKLGLTPKEINKSTDAILSLAQATGHDLAESATIVASTMNSFGMEASQATKVADMFAVASSSAAIDMEKLSTAMPTVGATANAVGVPLEELTSMMMTLADSGMEASTMGTHLRKIFVELATKGISFNDAMVSINNSTDKVTTATELFGKRAFGAGLILAGNIQKTADYNDMLDKSAGQSKKMADIMDSGASGAMRRLASQAEGVAIQLGQMLIPVFEKLMGFIQKSLRWWSGLDDGMKKIIVSVGLFLGALGPAIGLIGSLTVAFSALISPIGLVVLAITAIVVAFAYVRENWEAFKERLSDWDWWKNALIQATQWLIEFSPISLLIKGFNEVLTFFGKNPIPNPFQDISDGLEGLKVDTKEYENQFGSFADAMKNQAKELAGALGVLNNPLGLGGGLGAGGGVGGGDNSQSHPFVAAPQGGDMGPFNQIQEVVENTTDKLSTLQNLIKDINLEIQQNFEGALYGAMTAQENFFDSFIANMKKAIGQMMAMHAAQQITNALFGVATGGAVGGIGGIFGKLLGLHTGGLVTGPTLAMVGEGGGTSISNPEVVAPLDKLRSMMGSGVQQIEVQGRLSGTDIWLSNSKTTNSRLRSV